MTFAILVFIVSWVSFEKAECDRGMSGPTDDEMLQTVTDSQCSNPVIEVSSVGGDGGVALKIAEELSELKAEILVNEVCFSSCAEFLLAGADAITFEDRPLIGFHGNPPMKEWLARHFEVPNIEYCEFQESDHMYDLYFERDMNFGFWRQQLDVLTLQAFAVDPEIATESCPKMGFDFEHEMWFPSSATLRDDLGLNFTGSVCADDIEACAARVRAMFPNRGTFVIDDRVIDTRVAM